MTLSELYQEIEKVEMNPNNVVGGSKAFFSGHKTELNAKAKGLITKLQKQIDSLGGDEDE